MTDEYKSSDVNELVNRILVATNVTVDETVAIAETIRDGIEKLLKAKTSLSAHTSTDSHAVLIAEIVALRAEIAALKEQLKKFQLGQVSK